MKTEPQSEPLSIVSGPAQSTPQRYRVLLVDDHPIFRKGVDSLIRATDDLAICGVADDRPSTLEQITRLRPDLVVLDRTLRDERGMGLLEEIVRLWPEQRVLMLSMHDETLFAARALSLGAAGYVMKDEAPETLLAAIRQVLRDEVYLSERMSNKLLRRSVNARTRDAGIDPLDGLTPREAQVFQLLGQGKGTCEIAAELGVGAKTVETFRGLLKEKLRLVNGLELVRYAVESTRERRPAS